MRLLPVIMLLFALLAVLPVDASRAVAQGSCLSQRDQRQAVRSGEAVRPGRIGRRLGGKILRLSLCQEGSGLVWHVTLLQGDGRVVDLVVDARSGRSIR